MKIIKSRTLFGIYPPKSAVQSRSGVDVIGKLSGLRLISFVDLPRPKASNLYSVVRRLKLEGQV